MVEGTRRRQRARRTTTGRTSRCATGRRGSTRSARQDPSLGVAHGCFWKYHPARAWAWELRLQDEIGPDFRIEEAPYRRRRTGDHGSRSHRDAFLRDHAEDALAAIEKEAAADAAAARAARLVPELRILERACGRAMPTMSGTSNSA